jgi:hypothetical protein
MEQQALSSTSSNHQTRHKGLGHCAGYGQCSHGGLRGRGACIKVTLEAAETLTLRRFQPILMWLSTHEVQILCLVLHESPDNLAVRLVISYFSSQHIPQTHLQSLLQQAPQNVVRYCHHHPLGPRRCSDCRRQRTMRPTANRLRPNPITKH